MKYKSIRGFKDILPDEIGVWQEFEAAAKEIFVKFNYREIRTPIMEETSLFRQSVGEDTDIVGKEMFSFMDRGERAVTLRPEGTASVVRAYLENNLYKLNTFQKLFYIGPMFRAERPQAGRLRQFHQIGAEAIGSGSPALDAEVINLMTKVLDSCGIKGYVLKLNNLGCRDDKRKLSGILNDNLSEKGASAILCDDCKKRLKTNPLRVLDCKNEDCRSIVRSAFKKAEFLCGACIHHFDEVLKFLNLSGVKYDIDRFIVRGLDYYTSTVFEVVHPSIGSQNAIGAGGRYDNLITDLGGPKLGACGFALGMDRMALTRLKSRDENKAKELDIFIATIGGAALEKGFSLSDEFRIAGFTCDMDYEARSLKSQMRSADKLGARFVLIIGDDEMKKGEAVLRDMRTQEQSFLKFEDVVGRIKSIKS